MQPHDPIDMMNQLPDRAPTVAEFAGANVGGLGDAFDNFLHRGRDAVADKLKKEAADTARSVGTVVAIGAVAVVGGLAVSAYFAGRQAKRRAELGARFLDRAIEERTGVAGVATLQTAKAARDVPARPLPSWMRDAASSIGCGCGSCSAERRR